MVNKRQREFYAFSPKGHDFADYRLSQARQGRDGDVRSERRRHGLAVAGAGVSHAKEVKPSVSNRGARLQNRQ